MGGGKKKKGKKRSQGTSAKKDTKNAGPTRKAAGAAVVEPVAAVLLDDVSRLLFAHPPSPTAGVDAAAGTLPALPFVGPIAVADRTGAPGSVVVHGRGLVAARDIQSGECLFVARPVACAPAREVRRRFLLGCGDDGGDAAGGRILEGIAEEVLVERMMLMCDRSDEADRRASSAFLAQMSSDEVPAFPCSRDEDGAAAANSRDWISLLLATEMTREKNAVQPSASGEISSSSIDKEILLNIIRRNAFGPDYHSYDAIARLWSQQRTQDRSHGACCPFYRRLLGVYPLAAMINHSCCPNAVRVFTSTPSSVETNEEGGREEGDEVMIVHANAPIRAGEEILWSYIPPTMPHSPRRRILSETRGFGCRCVRCRKESDAYDPDVELELNLSERLKVVDGWQRDQDEGGDDGRRFAELVDAAEDVLADELLSNEVQRYIRVGFAQLYIHYFNSALDSNTDGGQIGRDGSIVRVLGLATQVHFSFVACNNASTEHLSVLHLCYELSSILHARGTEAERGKTMTQVRFWTDQLKKAHLVRYGALGDNIEHVRSVMKHTRMVLRNQDGWSRSGWMFI